MTKCFILLRVEFTCTQHSGLEAVQAPGLINLHARTAQVMCLIVEPDRITDIHLDLP